MPPSPSLIIYYYYIIYNIRVKISELFRELLIFDKNIHGKKNIWGYKFGGFGDEMNACGINVIILTNTHNIYLW